MNNIRVFSEYTDYIREKTVVVICIFTNIVEKTLDSSV